MTAQARQVEAAANVVAAMTALLADDRTEVGRIAENASTDDFIAAVAIASAAMESVAELHEISTAQALQIFALGIAREAP